jgi:hypothetical protein
MRFSHPVRTGVVLLLLAATTNLFLGCGRYYRKTTLRPDSRTQAAALQKLGEAIGKNKYILVYQDSQQFYATDSVLSDTTLTATLAQVPGFLALTNASIDARRGRRYKSSEKPILQEVRVHLVPRSEPLSFGKVDIPVRDIRQIDIFDRNTGATTASYVLGATGILLGAAAILGIIIALTKESCPFVYSWDGESYTLEGEIYSGAIFRELARNDYLELRYLRPVEGEYHVRVANELLERQYIDRLGLVEITHDAATRVLLDKHGNPHSIHEPVSPIGAETSGGVDYLDVLTHADRSVFLFNEGDSAVSSVTLTFPKPEAAEHGKLIIRAKNTMWLDHVFGEYTSQFGSLYERWVDRMNEKSHDELMGWMRAQSLPLAVSKSTDRGWVEVDYFDMVGPLTDPRDLVMDIDLADTPGETVTVRLETGLLFWELDYAAMDYSAAAPIEVAYVAPARARTLEGEDVLELLSAADDRYLEQFEVGEAVDVHFRASAVPPGLGRTLFLLSQGYYEHIRHYDGIPDVPYLMTFRKPGRFTEFAREKYVETLQQDNAV